MKLPKQIRLNYWWINRKPILLLSFGFLVLFLAANIVLNLIEYLTNLLN